LKLELKRGIELAFSEAMEILAEDAAQNAANELISAGH